MKKKKVISIGLIAVIGITVTFLYLFKMKITDSSDEMVSSAKSPEKSKVLTVKTVELKETTFTKAISLTGSVEPYKIARLASASEGPVERIFVREGDIVKRGQILATIGRRKGAESIIASRKEDLEKEEENLARTTQLVEKEIIPLEELDKARSEHEKAKTLLIQAEEQLEDHYVRSPWSGTVSSLIVREGAFVAPRTIIMEMYDPRTLIVSVDVPERNAVEVTKESTAKITFDAHPGKTFTGKVSRIHPLLDQKIRTRKVEISLNEKEVLLPGMFARVNLNLKEINNAIMVPANAIQTNLKNETFVFIAKNGKSSVSTVTTGYEKGGTVQIIDGVSSGETLIVSGFRNLKDGTAVQTTVKSKNKE